MNLAQTLLTITLTTGAPSGTSINYLWLHMAILELHIANLKKKSALFSSSSLVLWEILLRMC